MIEPFDVETAIQEAALQVADLDRSCRTLIEVELRHLIAQAVAQERARCVESTKPIVAALTNKEIDDELQANEGRKAWNALAQPADESQRMLAGAVRDEAITQRAKAIAEELFPSLLIPPRTGPQSRRCKAGQHEWCFNSGPDETHCGCACHIEKEQRRVDGILAIIESGLRALLAEQEQPELSCLMCGFAKKPSRYSATKGCFICVDCVYQHHGYIEMVNLAAAERGRAIQAEAAALTQLATESKPEYAARLKRIILEKDAKINSIASDARAYWTHHIARLTETFLEARPAAACDCGAALTQCAKCAMGEWQAAHPECPDCCPPREKEGG